MTTAIETTYPRLPGKLQRHMRTRRPAATVQRRRTRRGERGFSLIEIMVVVIIIGLIMGGVGFGVFQYLKRARIKTTEQALDVLRSSVRMYQNDHPGQCPTTEQLQSEGFLDRNRATTDGWGRAFHIECNGEDVGVRSDGPDGRPGTEDDIPNANQNRPAS